MSRKMIQITSIYIAGKHFARVDTNRVTDESKTYFYNTDHLGSTMLVTDEAGKISWTAEYTPFGSFYQGELENPQILNLYVYVQNNPLFKWVITHMKKTEQELHMLFITQVVVITDIDIRSQKRKL